MEKTLEGFETRLKTRDMTESARRACMTCAKEFAAYLMEGDSVRPRTSS